MCTMLDEKSEVGKTLLADGKLNVANVAVAEAVLIWHGGELTWMEIRMEKNQDRTEKDFKVEPI